MLAQDLAHTIRLISFSLADIHLSVQALLRENPDPIPTYRLLNEVLHLPAGDKDLQRARCSALNSIWSRQLVEAQLPDGSWGRFHSQDTKKKTVFRTTEEAIDRAFALGCEPDQAVLNKARQYILNVLGGATRITDRDEKSESWPLLIKFMLEGRLAQIDPGEPRLDLSWKYLAEVTRQAFASGRYSMADEANAYFELSEIHLPKGFLESQHALWILCSRQLPTQLERALVEWVWHKPDGIRYLRAPLHDLQPRLIAYWLRSMNILTYFSSWREVSLTMLNRLWGMRDDMGLWDFGPQIARSIDFPISESWRERGKRKVDYSTCVLALLRRYFD
jgi:hypothetical protein